MSQSEADILRQIPLVLVPNQDGLLTSHIVAGRWEKLGINDTAFLSRFDLAYDTYVTHRNLL